MDQTKKKILLIEDDPLLVKMYSSKFEKEGFTVISAGDGEEGLSKALNELPDFMILDVMMPRLSGIDMLTKLRSDERGKNISAIVISNLTSGEEEKKAKDLGAKEYLIKANITPSQLVAKIRQYLK